MTPRLDWAGDGKRAGQRGEGGRIEIKNSRIHFGGPGLGMGQCLEAPGLRTLREAR